MNSDQICSWGTHQDRNCSNMEIHLLQMSSNVVSSKAILPILPKVLLAVGYNKKNT